MMVRLFVALVSGFASSSLALAQEFQDVQQMSNKVLFAASDAAGRRRETEIRRVEALDQKTREQDTVIHEQDVALRQLGSELQAVRDERQLLSLASSFDAAVTTRQWAVARTFLADSVAGDLIGSGTINIPSVSADAFIVDLSRSPMPSGSTARFNQQVRVDMDHAVLTEDGLPWHQSAAPATRHDKQAGRYEYGFIRTATGWKINALVF